jgi:hypothetical protein
VINTSWITRLLIERRPLQFSPEEKRLYDEALRAMKPRHARKLFEAARWKTIASSEQIVRVDCVRMMQGRHLLNL